MSLVPRLRTRLIMSEKSDGTVAMHCGEIEDLEFLAAEDHLLTLPNTVSFNVEFFLLYLNIYI